MIKEQNVFIDFLKKKSLKLTSQRQIILRIFLATEKHISVEELYDIVKKKDSGIGLATVFRTLKLLRDAGIAKEVDLGDKKTRYEHKYGHEHHDHIICVRCGKFIEVVDPEIESLQEKLCKKIGFLAEKHKMEIFGICKKCRAEG